MPPNSSNQNFGNNKLELTNFLKNKLHFRSYRAKNDKNGVYFYNVNSPNFQIVYVTSNFEYDLDNYNFENAHISFLKSELTQKYNHLKIRVLYAVFSEKPQALFQKDNNVVVFMQNNNWVKQLTPYFPEIKKYFDDKEIDINKISMSDISNPESKLNKDARKLKNRLNLNNLFVVWFSLFAFVIIPISIYFLMPLFGLRIQGTSNPQVNALAFGATMRDAVFGANQWWRLLTYPFSQGSDFIWLIIMGIFLFSVSRYSELIFPVWKIFLTMGASILIYGFLFTVLVPEQVMTGPLVVVASLYGLIFMGTYKNTSLTAVTAKARTAYVAILLFIIPLIEGNLMMYVNIFMAFIIGCSFGFIYTYDYDHVSWTFYFPFIILGSVILIPIIIAVLPNNFIHPNNLYFIATLQLYYNAQLMSQQSIINILEKYYHIPSYQISQYISF